MKSRYCSIAGIALAMAFVSIMTPISKAETTTSPAKAGAIYQLQGEYMGVVEAWGGTWGAQIMAVSEKKISIHLLEGGLPGQGFKGKVPTKKYEARINSDKDKEKVEVSKDSVTIVLKPNTLEISDATGKQIGVLTLSVLESVAAWAI